MLTLLSTLFVTDRHRLRAGFVGHAMPLAIEVDVSDRSIEPILVTTTRGTFVESRVSRHGYARYGISECPLDGEPVLLREFYRLLVGRGQSVAGSLDEAVVRMRVNGLVPRHVVAGAWAAPACPSGVKLLDAGFPVGQGLLVTDPVGAGLHTRVGDYVGILAYRVNTAFVALS